MAECQRRRRYPFRDDKRGEIMTRQTVAKTIRGQNGKLYITSGGNRYRIAECEARIEIIEERDTMTALGSADIIRRRYASILVTFDHRKANIPVSLDTVDSFGFQGEFLRKDGKYKIFDFPRCLLASDLDLTDGGACTFEIECSDETIAELYRM